jgi:transcriptional regulator
MSNVDQRMANGKQMTESPIELLQGTLDLLILRTLLLGPTHGQRIAHLIKQTSEQVLDVGHGSLYPALQRLERRGWITSEWRASENNRRARFYRLTAAGRKQLMAETTKWERLSRAIAQVMRLGQEEG